MAGQSTANSVDPRECQASSRVACIGLGYVGYHSAIAFCESDHTVIGVDTDEALVETIRDGTQPFETDALKPHIDRGRCGVTTRMADTADCDVYVVSVPTPVDDDDSPDLSYLRTACRDVATVLEEGDLVVIQSTVYPGCTRTELLPELERSGLEPGTDFGVSHVPERYSPGDAKSKTTPRVVGSIDDDWRAITVELYEDVTASTVPVSSLEVAETIKLAENIQRDVNIAIINELVTATDHLGIDIWEVIEGADTKWNFHRYEPRLGVGGHCLPIDPHYFRAAVERSGEDLNLIPTAREINRSMPNYYCERIRRTIGSLEKPVSAATVSVLGVTYKSGVKDTRNSPALQLIRHLREEGISVTVYDPKFEPGDPISGTDLANEASAASAVRNSDVIVVAAGHDEFEDLDPATLETMAADRPAVLDLQRALDPDEIDESELIRVRESSPATRPSEFELTPMTARAADRRTQEGDDD